MSSPLMVRVPTSSLVGRALEWAVAQAEGKDYRHDGIKCRTRSGGGPWRRYTKPNYSPSTDWVDGGPLIAKHGMSVSLCWNVVGEDQATGPREWRAGVRAELPGVRYYGPVCETPLLAVCRAVVAAKLGEAVYVPESYVEVRT